MVSRILLIENDAEFADRIRAGFQSAGATVDTAVDGPSGLKQAGEAKPDVILVSAELPGMNGFLVCRKFKRNEELHDVPLIILSSLSDEDTFEQHRKLETRAQDYIRKPIAFEDLLERVRQVTAAQAPQPHKHSESQKADAVDAPSATPRTRGKRPSKPPEAWSLAATAAGKPPRLLVLASRPAKAVAEAIRSATSRDMRATVYFHEGDAPSARVLRPLLLGSSDHDLAVLVLAPEEPDDSSDRSADTRKEELLFRLGVLVGAFGTTKSFVVQLSPRAFELPQALTDAAPAVIYLADGAEDDLDEAVAPVCEALRAALQELRTKRSKA